MSWKCKDCEVEYKTSHDVDYADPRAHSTENLKIKCPNDHGEMLWVPAAPTARVIDATFDYTFQVYRDSKGTLVKAKDKWDFPCPKCCAPAELLGCSAYSESHRCLECKYEFEVK